MLDFGFYNMDCMEGMKQFPDKYFDLAIVDPPYGININNNIGRRKGDKHSNYPKAYWDNTIPDKSYFNELLRVSKQQIIWGGTIIIYRLQSVL
jgi:site-specific DNA-methyltransferase (adenine-specific)